jgi:hypothetical protein
LLEAAETRMGTDRSDRFTIHLGDLVLVKEGEGLTFAELRVREILRKVRALAVEYYALTGKPLGVTGEIAEFEAAEKLGLRLADARTPDYDAIRETDQGIQHIQIKGRAMATPQKPKPGQRMPRIKTGARCDSVLLVILDNEDLQPWGMWEAPYSKVLELLARGGKSRERGALSVREFQRNAEAVWTRHS